MKATKIVFVSIAACLSGLSLCAQQQGTAANSSTAPAPVLHNFADLDKKPTPTKRVQPLYPAELKAARKTGEAVVTFVVDVDGSVKNARVEKATDPAFGEAALAAVSAWEFEPGSKNGTPVACQLSLPLRFALSN